MKVRLLYTFRETRISETVFNNVYTALFQQLTVIHSIINMLIKKEHNKFHGIVFYLYLPLVNYNPA